MDSEFWLSCCSKLRYIMSFAWICFPFKWEIFIIFQSFQDASVPNQPNFLGFWKKKMICKFVFPLSWNPTGGHILKPLKKRKRPTWQKKKKKKKKGRQQHHQPHFYLKNGENPTCQWNFLSYPCKQITPISPFLARVERTHIP